MFNGVDDQTNFDLLIYHPRTRYIKNRPHWLAKSGKSNFVAIEKERVLNASYPIIIEAFPLNEKYSVPVDVVELKAESDETELILPTGKYMVRLTNSEGNVVEYTVDLKH